MDKVILVLAGNYDEYMTWLSRNVTSQEEQKRYIYIDHPDRVAGYIAEKVLEVGTWYQKPNAFKLRELALERVR